MRIKIDNKERELDFQGRISDLLDSLSLNPETLVVLKNGKVVSEDEKAGNDDILEIISAVSSG
jgi:sulfur carrier protein